MAKHAAPHTNYDGTPLPLVHFPGPFTPGGLTPCGIPFMTRDVGGQLVTAVPSAIDPHLVNCEACYAVEDMRHRQDHTYGRHSAVTDIWAATQPTTSGQPSESATEDVRVWNDDAGMEHISGGGTELWFRRAKAIEDFNLTLNEGGLFG